MLRKVKNDQRFAGLPRIVRNSDLFLQSWRSISAGTQETLRLLPLALIQTGPRESSIRKAGRGRSGSERALRFVDVDDRGKTYHVEALCWQTRGLGKPPGNWLHLLREPRLFRSPCAPTSLSQPHEPTWAMRKGTLSVAPPPCHFWVTPTAGTPSALFWPQFLFYGRPAFFALYLFCDPLET